MALLFTIIAGIAGIGAYGLVKSLRRFIRTILNREERAGRSLGKIIRDAFTETPAATPPEPTLEERIQNLSAVMGQSAKLLEQITADIELRAAFAKEKKEEADLAIAAASLNQEQLQALQRVVRTEVTTESNRGIRAAVLAAVFSFIFGVAATILVTLFVHPFHESQPSVFTPATSHSTSSPTGERSK